MEVVWKPAIWSAAEIFGNCFSLWSVTLLCLCLVFMLNKYKFDVECVTSCALAKSQIDFIRAVSQGSLSQPCYYITITANKLCGIYHCCNDLTPVCYHTFDTRPPVKNSLIRPGGPGGPVGPDLPYRKHKQDNTHRSCYHYRKREKRCDAVLNMKQHSPF